MAARYGRRTMSKEAPYSGSGCHCMWRGIASAVTLYWPNCPAFAWRVAQQLLFCRPRPPRQPCGESIPPAHAQDRLSRELCPADGWRTLEFWISPLPILRPTPLSESVHSLLMGIKRAQCRAGTWLEQHLSVFGKTRTCANWENHPLNKYEKVGPASRSTSSPPDPEPVQPVTKCHRGDERSDQRDDHRNPDQRHAQQHDQRDDADQTNKRQRKNDGEWPRLSHGRPGACRHSRRSK